MARLRVPQAMCPALRALLVLHLLLVDYLGKVAAVVVVQVERVVLVVRAVAAQAVVAVAQHAVHMPQALAVSAVMAGHWYWSSDDGQIRCC